MNKGSQLNRVSDEQGVSTERLDLNITVMFVPCLVTIFHGITTYLSLVTISSWPWGTGGVLGPVDPSEML